VPDIVEGAAVCEDGGIDRRSTLERRPDKQTRLRSVAQGVHGLLPQIVQDAFGPNSGSSWAGAAAPFFIARIRLLRATAYSYAVHAPCVDDVRLFTVLMLVTSRFTWVDSVLKLLWTSHGA
jgi:hypothetical protein